ncbi:hypothetical protein LQ938_15160 [Microbacterium sp. cx-55]|uniref:hypothetical protein n=1 Tax=Microbacterium sp. cx-55 TaxID=2875948 RepID=UPI001CBAF846|nr:hypothetical protein [Microbacterium sp. cx-55]MBZ4487139.1 hypothetical protein [Microbacterium sp. cx-55]UGB35173.1 hypothetical protein LQ938_15160 [Microbacterium sp. cx-55]
MSSGVGNRNGTSWHSNTRFDSSRLTMATTKYFEPDWGTEVTASLPVRFDFAGRAVKSLRIDWDERLFAVHGPAYAVVDGDTVELGATGDIKRSLHVELPDGATELVLRSESLNAYPNENLRDVQRASFRMTTEDASEEEWADTLQSAACNAWSLEATVNWVCHEGVVVPARAVISSIGPYAAPTGVSVGLQYADIVGAPALAPTPGDAETEPVEVSATIESTMHDGVREAVLVTTGQLEAGQQIELVFEVDASDSKPQPFREFVPRLIVTPPQNVSGMRLSEKHSSFPVTPSGSHLSTYEPAPTA